MQGRSSNGRTAVSKTDGWGFESLHPCQTNSKSFVRAKWPIANWELKMSANKDTQSSSFDSVKWIVTVLLLAAAVIGNHYYTEEVSVLYRAVAVVVLVGLAGFTAAATAKGKKFLSFAKESRTEVRKVVWPSRQEATQTTLIVVVATVIVALVLWGLDGILVRLVGFITGLEI